MECLKVCHDIKNATVMEVSPIDKIAKMMDFYYPYFFAELLGMIEDKGIEEIKAEFKVGNAEAINEKNYQLHLAEVFWAVYTKLYNNIADILFLNDYYLYFNFFLQYPIVTGKEVCSEMSFEKILQEYRSIKIKGNVYRFIEDVEYVLVAGIKRREDDDDDMVAEIYEVWENSCA